MLDELCACWYVYAHIHARRSMPHSAQIQHDRQEAIRQFLAAGPVATQRQLVQELISQGFQATQSSVSRDLKELGVITTAAGYELPSPAAAVEGIAEVAGLVRDIQPAGPNLLVIKTAIGAAQRVALVLDRSEWPEIVGNVGGDDTVFTATGSASAQRNLISKIERAAARP
jgi:transcriptional regulator of arginine metabolism